VADHARFDEYAADYDHTVQRAISASGETVQFFAELKVRLMARALANRQPNRILDFGCGIGNTSRALSAGFAHAQITGFDVSEESIAAARAIGGSRNSNINYATTHDDRLPFADASFDAVFTSCVFHHIDLQHRSHWAREIRRTLKPKGSFVFFEHNPFNPLTRQVVRNIPFDDGVILVTPNQARSLLERANFRTSRPTFYFFFPAFLRALRRIEPMLSWIPIGAQYFVVATAG